MKKFVKIFYGLVATACLSASAFAAAPASQPATNGGAMMAGGSAANGDHPCKEIAEACKAAGFTKGAKASGKGIGKDCMKPLMAGSAVPGVSVTPEQIAACKAKMAARGSK